MARYEVFRHVGGRGYLLDVQSDLLSDLNSRVVVPLMQRVEAPAPAQRLNPVLKIDDVEWVMVTQFMAAVPRTELKDVICRLDGYQTDISAALDMLFLGF